MTTREEFFSVFGIAASLAGVLLTREVLDFYNEELAPFGWDQATIALRRRLGETTPRTGLPTVAQLKADLGAKEPTDDELARDAAARIWKAVGFYGLCDGIRALDWIGELAAEVVRMLGGWEQTVFMTDPEGSQVGCMAQWRELAKIALLKARRGELNNAPRLPDAGGGAGVVARALRLIATGEET